MSHHLGEDIRHHSLERGQDIFLLHKGHLTIDLRELRLTIVTQILISETFHDLKVSIETGDHEKLLEGLRRLRQRKEVSRIGSRRNDEISRTLGCGLDQNRCLHLTELLLVQRLSYHDRDTISQQKTLLHLVSSKIQVSKFQSRVLLRIRLVLNQKRWCLARVQNSHVGHVDLDLTRRSVLVRVLTSALHITRDLKYELSSDLLSSLVHLLRISSVLNDTLRDTVSVAKIDEHERTLISAFLFWCVVIVCSKIGIWCVQKGVEECVRRPQKNMSS